MIITDSQCLLLVIILLLLDFYQESLETVTHHQESLETVTHYIVELLLLLLPLDA